MRLLPVMLASTLFFACGPDSVIGSTMQRQALCTSGASCTPCKSDADCTTTPDCGLNIWWCANRADDVATTKRACLAEQLQSYPPDNCGCRDSYCRYP